MHRLIDVLQKLVDAGNTVVVIEHNLDLIKTADHIIDLGPEGGDKGGFIVAEGTPEEIAKVESSYTGRYLKKDVYKRQPPNPVISWPLKWVKLIKTSASITALPILASFTYFPPETGTKTSSVPFSPSAMMT